MFKTVRYIPREILKERGYLQKPTNKGEDINEMGVKQIRSEGKHCVRVISAYDKWRTITSKVINFRFPNNEPNFLISLDSQGTPV